MVVVKYDHEDWQTMLQVRNSLNWYSEQPNSGNYAKAAKKEKSFLKFLIKKGGETVNATE